MIVNPSMPAQPWVLDDFYPSPDCIRAQALRMPFHQVEGFSGWRTRPYQVPAIRSRIESWLGVHIVDWSTDPGDFAFGNGSFFKAFSGGRYIDPVAVHVDRPTEYVTLVIYLTPRAPPNGGTSFWRHRETSLVAAPTSADSQRLGTPIGELAARLNEESHSREKWVEVARVDNRYNRAVSFRSGVLHSATRHFGRTLNGGRLYQTFRFSCVPRAEEVRHGSAPTAENSRGNKRGPG